MSDGPVQWRIYASSSLVRRQVFYLSHWWLVVYGNLADKRLLNLYLVTGQCQHAGCRCPGAIEAYSHDDVIKWKHFPRHWPFVRWIQRSSVNSPHKGQWRGVLMFSLICAWMNDWVNNREAGDLRRHRAHYDVTVVVLVAMRRQAICNHCDDPVVTSITCHEQNYVIFISLYIE